MFLPGSKMLRLAALLGCLLVPVAAQAIEGSGKDWGARDPGACPSIKLEGAPTAEQVDTMLRCQHEVALSTGELWLMENLKIEVGGSAMFADVYSTYVMEDANINSTAHYIRGSYTWSVCITKADAALGGNADKNCYEMDVPSAKGVCWQTNFADWRCRYVGSTAERRNATAPPQ